MQPSNSITAKNGIFTFPPWNILEHMTFIWKILNSRHSSPINLMALQMRYDISITVSSTIDFLSKKQMRKLRSRPLECVIMNFPHYLRNKN
ncbi:hypothetical protein T01_14224 [Trichinella spiralis]|uniref:Uncharacterized protein n=1 Tax=Trichinella spiralis TaxID=6334 RepID=A0A0V1B7X9_TRISP|nr:hypothetical protein T01_14224 [Trichinella spiralis]